MEFLKSNKNKIILDLCGGTGAWSNPYKNAGYDVKVITLPEYNVKNIYFYRNIELTIKSEIDIIIPYSKIYGILAAPPCTMFSLARTTAKTPRNFKQGMEVVKICLHIIWNCRYKTKLKFWAIENPMGYLRQFLGKPIFTFDPCDFGDPYTKKTDLWGYFNIPKKNPIKLSKENIARCKINNRKLPSIIDITRNADRRAITPQGFAKAFYKANK
jgi:site-specific DNA-cytosine methylase